ncbi:MAG: primosomal protein N' [Muribaculaceae bacterium]|nr:primosomal protein N' [Muribaculaceae bacterium]
MFSFAEIILPLPLYGTYTYHVPEELNAKIKIGCRVLVQFGQKKYYTGIVYTLHNNKPEDFVTKDIEDLLDDYPILRYPQLKLWDWISDYYLCSLGDVFKAAIPAGLKIESETEVRINPDFEVMQDENLKERELIVLDFVSSRDSVKIIDIEKATGFKNLATIVMRLIEQEAVFVNEKVINNYKPKIEVYVALCCDRGDETSVHSYFDLVRAYKKQETLLLTYLEMSHWMRKSDTKEILKKDLLSRSGITQQVLSTMIKKGIMRIYKKEINRFKLASMEIETLPTLSESQQKAYWDILDSYKEKNITLLHGVTSSGKTEIYINLISEMLRQKKQILYLVPEIALTTQLTYRLKRVFGEMLLIYHSKFSDNERVDIWKKLLKNGSPCIVLGVRSSVFLPFNNLGLVIVDEEHETSFKQQDPSPRYNARNVAMVLASMHGAKTLLGTATPSIDSYYNATHGKYALVELNERYEGIELPEVRVVDLKLARKRREMKGIFSPELLNVSRKALEEDKQVILFQNRRGYAPMVMCKECAWVPKCDNCDVSLTYHKYTNTLICHYCGFTYQLPQLCPSCKQPTLEIEGYGTERIEDDIETVFPDTPILRMDLDTTRNKNSYEKIIEDFSKGTSKILVGTQMVTKGLDFAGVKVVGVLNADSMINFPDFRSHERAFNMLEQVSGRAGRKDGRGVVVIQTSNPNHPVINYVLNHDYAGYYNNEIEEREYFKYPPFTKLINIYLKHRDDNVLTEVSVRYSNMLREVFGYRVLGPEAPMIARIQQLHIRQIVLKIENEASMLKVKKILRQVYENIIKVDSRMKSTILYYDVDPM